MQLPYDPDRPPADPPPGSDRALWMVSYSLWTAHQPHGDGMCVVSECRDQFMVWPCHPSRIASAGLVGASMGWVPRRRRAVMLQGRQSDGGVINSADMWAR